jgi:hypothetical protein
MGNLRLPPIGRPKIPTGPADVFADDAITFSGELAPDVVVASLRQALEIRMGLRAPSAPLEVSYVKLGDPIDIGGGTYRVPVAAAVAERTLYDVVIFSPEGAPHVVAPHAVYYRSDWTNFGIAHVTDIHAARRIDFFQDRLIGLGRQEAADRMYNWNDRFRGFIKYANYMHSTGALDVILATGDITDFMADNDDDERIGGNMRFVREILLGQSPGRPPVDQVEELRVPIFVIPGNHDYRQRPYKLRAELHVPIFDDPDLSSYGGFNLSASDALAVTRGDNGTGIPTLDADEAVKAVEIDKVNQPYVDFIAGTDSYTVNLGPHRIAMLNSRWDVGVLGASVTDMLKAATGWLSEDEKNFMEVSPNSEGVADGDLNLVRAAMNEAGSNGLFILGIHAPLINKRQLPYYFRETMHAQFENCATNMLFGSIPIVPNPEEYVRSQHPTWYRPNVDYFKYGTVGDGLDYGSSRGPVDKLLTLLAGAETPKPADVVLQGHVHVHEEVRLELAEGELRYFTDHYTFNPTGYYPTEFIVGIQPTVSTLSAKKEKCYVFISPGAANNELPSECPMNDSIKRVAYTPPYPNPLNDSTDPATWWQAHRPLLLQTEPLGPLKFAWSGLNGFRVISVKNNIIDKIHFVSINRLNQSGYALPFEQAVLPEPFFQRKHWQRSLEHRSPKAKGVPFAYTYAPNGVQNIVYRDEQDRLIELWRDTADNRGNGNLTDTPAGDHHPKAAGNPSVYFDPVQALQIVPYRGTDGHVHTLYWSTDTTHHDALSQTAGSPPAAGDPVGCFNPATNEHIVVYRSGDNHIRTIYWTGQATAGSEDPTAVIGAVPAAGDPHLYLNTRTGMFIVPFRGTDGNIRSIYWTQTTPYGQDDLSGYAQTPKAGGDPTGYYLHDSDTHQIIYRTDNGHIYELWWVGEAPVSGWSVTQAAGAPAAAGNPAGFYAPGFNQKHVVYRGEDGHIYDLAWTPGGAVTLLDLTLFALAPVAKSDPQGYCDPNGQIRVVYVGADDHVQEIRLGQPSRFVHAVVNLSHIPVELLNPIG